jgi:hypothetical protein
VLLSGEQGVCDCTPRAATPTPGLVWMAIAAHAEADGGAGRRVAACLLLLAALQVYVSGSVESWTVAGGFGQRRFVALTAVLVIGLAALARAAAAPTARRVLAAVVAVAIYWNVALTVEFAIGLMDRQRLSPAANAYDAFVTLPAQLPSLAYRYLFDRASFYRPPPDAGRR